MANQIVMAGV
jgi:hypothetical protein